MKTNVFVLNTTDDYRYVQSQDHWENVIADGGVVAYRVISSNVDVLGEIEFVEDDQPYNTGFALNYWFGDCTPFYGRDELNNYITEKYPSVCHVIEIDRCEYTFPL